MIVGLIFMAQAVAPPTPPIMSIEALTDSAERQTLPAYKIDCQLGDSRGVTSHLKLEQTGGRGMRGTGDELRIMPAWRGFVSTAVSLKVLQDDADLTENSILDASLGDMPARIEIYRWDSRSRSYNDSPMQFRDGKTRLNIQLTVTPEKSDTVAEPLVFGTVITRRRDNRTLAGAYVGFCSIENSPQNPLSQAEEAEFRNQLRK